MICILGHLKEIRALNGMCGDVLINFARVTINSLIVDSTIMTVYNNKGIFEHHEQLGGDTARDHDAPFELP